MKRIGRSAVAAAVASLLLGGDSVAWADRGDASATVPCDFIVRNLGALPQDFAAFASGINNEGAAVGSSVTFDPVNFMPERPVMFLNRNVFLLHTLPNDP